MICGYCGWQIAEEEHRCGRCGRTPDDTLTPEFAMHHTSGALARQPRPAALMAIPKAEKQVPIQPADLASARQGVLFDDRPTLKVIPFRPPAPPRQRRTPHRPSMQGDLDLLPPLKTKPRTAGTTSEQMIYCEAPVADRLHRAVAAALDWSMILIAYGLFLLLFRLAGGEIVLTRINRMVFGGMLALIAFTYGLIWTLARTETAGMRWTRLRLITFDGFPPDARQRLLRFAGSCLSVCTVVGLLWSFSDEEGLNWQDHISRTFPTPAESDSLVMLRR